MVQQLRTRGPCSRNRVWQHAAWTQPLRSLGVGKTHPPTLYLSTKNQCDSFYISAWMHGMGSPRKAKGPDHPHHPSLLQYKNSYQQTTVSLAFSYLRRTLRITATTAFSSSFMQNRCQGSEHHEKWRENSLHMKNWANRFARPKMMMKTWKINLGHVSRSSWRREIM